MATRGGKPLLTRDDWTRAALDAMAEEGPGAVAIGRLARRLGATRGSFYWHFRDRRELLEAALARWEREDTAELIPAVEAIADPAERLRALFGAVYEMEQDPIELALASAAGDPVVAPFVARVTHARLGFLRRLFLDLGLPDAEAGDRAWLAYAFYVGQHQLGRNDEVRAARPPDLDRVAELLCRGPATPPAGGA